MNWAELLLEHRRVVIAGGPNTGKSTLALSVPHERIVGTDDYMGMDWEAIPSAIMERVQNEPTFILEGVQSARCLRRGLCADAVVWLDHPYPPYKPKHESMAKGIKTVFTEWREAQIRSSMIGGPKATPIFRYFGKELFPF